MPYTITGMSIVDSSDGGNVVTCDKKGAYLQSFISLDIFCASFQCSVVACRCAVDMRASYFASLGYFPIFISDKDNGSVIKTANCSVGLIRQHTHVHTYSHIHIMSIEQQQHVTHTRIFQFPLPIPHLPFNIV